MPDLSRPWCCPEPRCKPLWNHQVHQEPTPGESFVCFGRMERAITFTYDGNEHTNNLHHCDYTPLKGIILWQENADDWRELRTMYDRALAALGNWGGRGP